VARFIVRFQQFCAPVMAKGMEDTSFYVYNRLASLNDVGGDPRVFGVTVDAFHRAMQARARQWPHAMLAGSTHDSKRSEDVRARINVLAEMPAAWRLALQRWRRMNAPHKRQVAGAPAPSANDEYLLYQTLLGMWPDAAPDAAARADLAARVRAYMLKAVREAKVHTSWLNPDDDYEAALDAFIDAILAADEARGFGADFASALRRVSAFGACNSLAQTLLRLTAPGAPDLYQGSELLEYHLVDPDNRRPVDYARRRALLAGLMAGCTNGGALRAETLDALRTSPADGRAKLYLAWRALQARRGDAALWQHGDYVPLRVRGEHELHVCAFARTLDGRAAITVVPRLLYRMLGDEARLPVAADAWGDTRIELPPQLHREWVDVLGGANLAAGAALRVGDVLARFPVALLLGA
jgi:(1->4)-alpha-D-glucan 1-alpha-D-glucosylmutase